MVRSICFAVLLFACSSKPGVGDACTTSDATDECDDGLVCTKEATKTVCETLCDSASVTCPMGTTCTGISGGSHKSCQPTGSATP